MQEMQIQTLGGEDSLEKEMATPSSIPAWEIPWTGEPGRLESTGLQKSWTQLSYSTTTTMTQVGGQVKEQGGNRVCKRGEDIIV